jgi:hypothetical protein
VTGPLAPSRQPRRRRITPNANTSTTTMISTHNHVDMAASLVGAGAVRSDATAGHPSEQLGHRQASSRSRIDGRAARRLAGSRHPATGPPIWAGPAADQASAPVGRALPGHAQPAQPQPPHSAPHERRTRAGVTRPEATTVSRPASMARPSSVCPAWVGKQCEHGCAETRWQTPCRRCRTDGARLRGNPNLRPGRLHRPALPVQSRSALRAAPRMGPAGGDSAAHPPRPRSWVTAQVGCWVSWPG